jgi:hypothetical protein
MFNFFKKKNPDQSKELPDKPAIQLVDLNGMPLQEGDTVECLRYDLGRCKVVLIGKTYHYESLATGQQVSWLRMIDASTNQQKVKKIVETGGS